MTENQSLPSAYIKHQLPGRVRLKIPQKKGDAGYFERVAESFLECRNLIQLQLNPSVASLLVCHEPEADFSSIAEFAETSGLFSLTAEPETMPISLPILYQPMTSIASSGLNRVSESLQHMSQGRVDGRSLLFLTLLGMAAHQITRGQIMAPAASLIWYALDLLKIESLKSPEPNEPGNG